MPTKSSKARNGSKPKASNGSKPKAGNGSGARSQARKSVSAPTPSRGEQVRAAVESAVDLPVGAVLELGDRVVELVEPFSGRSAAQKRLESYRTQLRRTAKRSERRGAGVRRKATAEVRKTRTRVEREARDRQRRVETTLKRNRDEVEQRVRKAVEAPTARAQDLVDQLAALR